MADNKVVTSNGTVLIDLSGDTATEEDVVEGKIFHKANGEQTTGTHACSGGDTPNIQVYAGMGSRKGTSYAATGVALTVEKTGTYKVSWMGARNRSSGTFGTQLYIDGSAYGSATTTFTNTYGQSVILTGVSLTAGQTVAVYARSSNTNYAMMVGNLAIEQTA